MRLQQQVYGFNLQSGDNPVSKILTSKLVVNGKISEILVSELFYGIKKEKNNTIKGYSILQFLDEKGNIQINDKVFKLSFSSDNEDFILSSLTEPSDYTLQDKEMSEEEIKVLETKIESSAPVQQPEQPQEIETQETEAVAEDSIYENEDYEAEKNDLKEEGFEEYNTETKSNFRCLVRQESGKKDKILFIEISEDDYDILPLDGMNVQVDHKTKLFTHDC